ncbi:MAG: aerial mycelium formation protein [Actinobacteria bacterium]|nr:aerial mycelium formation protein [Actinomycetota bacterium]
MTAPMAGGRRRVDRVLDPEFVADLAGTDLRTLSAKRLDAEQEEVDLSYVRRLIQGRIDIATAEQQRRSSGSTESLVDQLASILSDDNSSTTGSGRHLNAQPSRVDEHRRVVERVVSDVRISDVATLNDEQLVNAIDLLRRHEEHVSKLRRRVQGVVDALAAEIGRRMAAETEATFN